MLPVGSGRRRRPKANAKSEVETRSLLGSYLAGRVARGQHDTEAAATYYRQALARDPGNDVLIEQSFLMELIEGNWPRAEELARALIKAQPTHRTAHAFMGLVEFKAQRYEAADEHFKAANSQPHRRADEHACARLALPCAGQDPGGAGRPRCAEAAAGLGAVLSALSPRAARRRGRTARRGARRLRAHTQERPAHAAHHARLRAACGQRRRSQAGAEPAQGALREDQERRPSRRPRAAGSDRGRRAAGPARRHPQRWAGGGVLRSRRGADRVKAAWARARSTCSLRSI